MLRTKSIRSPIEASDGLRVLAARFRGRGVSAERYDVWMANLGPSEALLRSFLDGRIAWKRFAAEYKKELFAPAAVDKGNKNIRNHGQKFTLRLLKHLAAEGDVTLLCHCSEDTAECHRHLLRQVIESKKV